MEFFLHCTPPNGTHQSTSMILKNPKTGKPFVGKKSSGEGRRIQDLYLALLLGHTPSAPLQGSLQLHVGMVYPWRKSEPKKNRLPGFLWKDTKPDADNLVKMLKDCMTRLRFWQDDAQVARLTVDKGWGDTVGIWIKLAPLPPSATPAYLRKAPAP